MIFSPRLAHLVMAGKKTSTRRIAQPGEERCRYVVGRSYAIQPGRGRSAIGRLRVTAVRQEALGELTFKDALAEGFKTRDDFWAYWCDLHGVQAPNLDQLVWVIGFEVDRAHRARLLHRNSERGYTDQPHEALEGEPEAVDPATLKREWSEGAERRHDKARAEAKGELEDRLASARKRARAAGVDTRSQEAAIERRIEGLERRLKDAS